MTGARPRGGDAGAAAIELVIVTPALILLLCLIAFAGRMVDAESDVVGAGRDAARAASIARSLDGARTAAADAAEATLRGEGLDCRGGVRVFGPDDFRAGAPFTVRVECDVALSDLTLIPVGSQTLTAEVVEVVDLYRGTR